MTSLLAFTIDEVPTLCARCILSGGAGGWGPFVAVDDSDAVTLNSAGCGALINGDTTTTGCGKALAESEACLDFTCQVRARVVRRFCGGG